MSIGAGKSRHTCQLYFWFFFFTDLSIPIGTLLSKGKLGSVVNWENTYRPIWVNDTVFVINVSERLKTNDLV